MRLWETTPTVCVSAANQWGTHRLTVCSEVFARPFLPSPTVILWPYTGYFTANLLANTVFMSPNLCTSTPHASLIYISRRHRSVNILIDREAKKGQGVPIFNGNPLFPLPRRQKSLKKSLSSVLHQEQRKHLLLPRGFWGPAKQWASRSEVTLGKYHSSLHWKVFPFSSQDIVPLFFQRSVWLANYNVSTRAERARKLLPLLPLLLVSEKKKTCYTY